MPFCFVSLGSNIAPEENFRRILQELQKLSPRLAVSRIVCTAPVGMPSSALFLNGVVRLQIGLAPAALKEALVAIEWRLGRDRDDPLSKVKDRVADLDILFCLPEEASAVPAALLPHESYVRPLLLELLEALGYQVDAAQQEPPAGHPLQFGGQTIGLAPLNLRHNESEQPKPMSEQPSDQRPAALVTGGAIRLGKAIALSLGAAGYDIALHFRSDPDKAAATAAEIRALGVRCQPFRADLADPTAIPSLISDVATHFPRFNLLVNSASAYTQAPIAATTAAIFDTQFGVNLRAPLLLIQAFAQQVGQGNIINIIDNKIGFNQFEYAAYLLSKKALAELTRLAALEFAPAIRVNGVAPGVVLPAGSRSPEYIAWRVQGIPLQRQGTTDQIGQAILSLLQNEFITGQILVVDGGEALTNTGQNAAQFDPKKI